MATSEFGTKPKWLNVRLAPLLGDKRTSNALFAGTRAVPVRMIQDGWHGLSSVIAGLDPAIHLLCKTLLRSGWTRGSSPRVTPENG